MNFKKDFFIDPMAFRPKAKYFNLMAGYSARQYLVFLIYVSSVM